MIISNSDLSWRKKNEKKKWLSTGANSSKRVLNKGIPIYPRPYEKDLITEFKVNFPGFHSSNKLFPGKTPTWEEGKRDWWNGPGSTGSGL